MYRTASDGVDYSGYTYFNVTSCDELVYTDKNQYVMGETVRYGIENTLPCNRTVSIGSLTIQHSVDGEWENVSGPIYTIGLGKWEVTWNITNETTPGQYRVKGGYGIGDTDCTGYAYFNITDRVNVSPVPVSPPFDIINESDGISIGNIPVFNATHNIVVNPILSNPVTINNVSIWGPLKPNGSSVDFLLNQNTTSHEEPENISSVIKSEILSEDAEALNYLQENPTVIDVVSESVIEELNETPALMNNTDTLIEEIKIQLINTQTVSSLDEQPNKYGIPWERVIAYILGFLKPSTPGIKIFAIGSWMSSESINFVTDTGGTMWAVTVEKDGNVIGTVGEKKFTWPWKTKRFDVDFDASGDHYVLAYPTIFKDCKRACRNRFTRGFVVRLQRDTYGGETSVINITTNITFNTTEIAKISVNQETKEVSINVSNFTVITPETLEIFNNKLYMNCSTGKKSVSLAPGNAVRQADLSKIKEMKLKDSGKPTYEIKGTKKSNLLGFIPVDMDVTASIDAQTGKVKKVREPWWSFLST